MLNALRQCASILIEELCATGTDPWEARLCVAFCVIPFVSHRSALFNVRTSKGLDSDSRPVIAAAEALLDVARPWSRRSANG